MAESLPQSLCLILTTVAFTVGVLFSNNAYDPHVDVLVAMTAANLLAVQRELGEARRASQGVK